MMAQLVEQRIRNAWVAGSSPARGSLSSASRACISLQKFFVCEISTSVVHGLPKPVRRVRLPYLARSSFQKLWKDFFVKLRKPLRTFFQHFRYNVPIFFIPLHQISER